MTVRDLVHQLVDYPMDAVIVVQRKLAPNVWVNSDPIVNPHNGAVVITFNFPEKDYKIKRKEE